MRLRRSRGERLPGEISYRKLEQMLRLAGCTVDPSGRRGDHVKITRRLPDGSIAFSTVQMKNNIPEGTYKAVLRQLGIPKDWWVRLYRGEEMPGS